MKLSALLSGYAQVAPHGDVDVDAVTFDSRKVKPRTVFIAAKGATPSSLHGKDFISAARAAGAAAIVADEDAASLGGGVYVVDDARRVGAVLAERVVGSPSSQLALAGVTGTNGKTTTTFLLASMAKAAKRRGAVFGTVGIGAPESPRATGFTTPEAETLSTQLRAVKDEGFDVVAMEVTSIALATARVDGLTFAAGGFTNLTHDHLDFHGDLERYFTAKARFFSELLPKTAPAVLPISDDEHGHHARLRKLRSDAITWGTTANARLQAKNVKATTGGLGFILRFDNHEIDVVAPALLGAFNLENALVAAGLALGLGLSLDDVKVGLATGTPPPGRMQRVARASVDGADDNGPIVVVDYAHTPDALERALLTARSFTPGKLFVVFGCGGDRDPLKRPVMGRIAADVADAVIATDDNPRSEDSGAILDAIAAGVADKKILVEARALTPGTWARVANRRLAIRAAIAAAADGDVVVIAGKGHERDQTSKGVKAPFDDVIESKAALAHRTRPAFLPRSFIEETLGSFTARTADVFAGVATDSRDVEPGALFVPLSGDRFDGHQFVEGALAGGAAGALVETKSALAASIAGRSDLPVVVVDDALAALQKLCHAWLLRQPAVRIALTGSNGKTTTKELIAAVVGKVVGAEFVLATEGNLNNHIGVPLTALRVEAHHKFAVLEMGMNHIGEIASYCRFAPPQIGLVTNMGTAHAGNVGGVEGVARAKAELFEALPKDGVAVVNADDARCLREAQLKAACRHLTFGTAPFADLRILDVTALDDGGQRLTLSYASQTVEVSLPLDGRHNADNAAGAVAVAIAAGLDFATAADGLADAHPAHGRLERRRRADGLLILDDSYNANPDSMEAGLETLSHIARVGINVGSNAGSGAGRRSFAALGPMLELGEHAPGAHKHIGAAAAQAGIDTLFVCGDLGKHLEEGARAAGLKNVVWAKDSIALAPLVREALSSSSSRDVVLVKGSRGARMERVVEALLSNEPSHPQRKG